MATEAQSLSLGQRVDRTLSRLRAGWQAITKGTLADWVWGAETINMGAPLSGWQWLNVPGPEMLLRGYKFNPWAHLKFMRVCSAIAMLDFEVRARGANGTSAVLTDEYPLTRLLNDPNAILTGWDFRFLCELYLRTTGELYVWCPANSFGKPQALWPIPRFWVHVNRDPSTKEITSYTLPFTLGATRTIPAKEMIWLHSPDPVNPYLLGVGDMLALATEIETFEYASESDKNFFLRDATPAGYLNVPGTPTEPERQKIKDDWRRRYGGFRNYGDVPVLYGGMSFELLRQNRKEMDFVEGQKYLRDVIIAGVHPHILGLAEDVNRANAEAAEYTFARWELLPRARWWESAINKHLAPRFNANVFFNFLRVVPYDLDRLLKTALDPMSGEVLTVRQRLSLLDRALDVSEQPVTESPYLDSYVIGTLRLPQPAAEPGSPPPKPTPTPSPEEPAAPPPEDQPLISPIFPGPGEPEQPINFDLSGGRRKSLAFEDLIPPGYTAEETRRLRRALQGVDPEARESFGRLIQAIKTAPNPNGPQRKATLRDIADILGALTETEKLLQRHLRPMYEQILRARWEDAIQEVGADIGFDVADPVVAEFLKEEAGARIRGIAETVRDKLRETLSEGVRAGESIPDLAKRVAAVFDEAKGSRATLIARTETLLASNTAANEAYTQAGVQKIEWLLAPDYDPSIDNGECEPYDGAVTEVGTPFAGGVDFPPLHPACRCSIAPYFETPEGEGRSLYVGEAREKRRTALGTAHSRLERSFLGAVKKAWQEYQGQVSRRLRAS